MGIVLPDGNLNNPSLTWLRRWAEGKARILAVVSLPEETFRSADATVRPRWSSSEGSRKPMRHWEEAWPRRTRNTTGFQRGARSGSAPNTAPASRRQTQPNLPQSSRNSRPSGCAANCRSWKQAEPPPYPRGVGVTTVGKPRWTGEASDKKRVRELRKRFEEAWTEEAGKKADALCANSGPLRKVDAAQNAALWQQVRETFDYPVFTAAPDTVGITSTGAEAPTNSPTCSPPTASSPPGFRLEPSRPDAGVGRMICQIR